MLISKEFIENLLSVHIPQNHNILLNQIAYQGFLNYTSTINLTSISALARPKQPAIFLPDFTVSFM